MKTSIKIVLVFFLAVLSSQCNIGQSAKSTSDASEIKLLNPDEFAKQSSKQIIIDVRTPKEFESGHIKEALNINFMDNGFLEQMAKLNMDKPVYLYCRSGKRSAAAAKKLKDLGFKDVSDLEGGILNWSKSKLETVK